MATKANRLKAITWIKSVFKLLTAIDSELTKVEKLAVREELFALNALYDFGSIEKIDDIGSAFKRDDIDEPKSAVIWALSAWINSLLDMDDMDSSRMIELLKSYGTVKSHSKK